MTNDECPLTLTLSPEYGGEGIRANKRYWLAELEAAPRKAV